MQNVVYSRTWVLQQRQYKWKFFHAKKNELKQRREIRLRVRVMLHLSGDHL